METRSNMTDVRSVLNNLIVRGPTWISVDNPNPLPGTTGVCIMQIFFQGSVNVQVIKFKNYYVHNIAIKCRSVDDVITNECKCFAETAPHVPWKRCIDRKVLMPNPDFEDGCQEYIFIEANESRTDWTNLSALLIILRQPSSRWKMFCIKELEILGQQNEMSSLPPMPVKINLETSSMKEEQPITSQDQQVDDDIELSPAILNHIENVKNLFKEIEKLKL